MGTRLIAGALRNAQGCEDTFAYGEGPGAARVGPISDRLLGAMPFSDLYKSFN